MNVGDGTQCQREPTAGLTTKRAKLRSEDAVDQTEEGSAKSRGDSQGWWGLKQASTNNYR